jgi:hypothetical protein
MKSKTHIKNCPNLHIITGFIILHTIYLLNDVYVSYFKKIFKRSATGLDQQRPKTLSFLILFHLSFG